MQNDYVKNRNIEILQRLETAQRHSNERLNSESLVKELHPGTDIANRWLCITASYSGLEQVFKFLLLLEKSITLEQLLMDNKLKSHDLSKLYEELSEPTKQELEGFYGELQSLLSFIPFNSLKHFFKEISMNSGKGYEAWRYSLIEISNALP